MIESNKKPKKEQQHKPKHKLKGIYLRSKSIFTIIHYCVFYASYLSLIIHFRYKELLAEGKEDEMDLVDVVSIFFM